MSKKDNKSPVKQYEHEELTRHIAFLKLKAHGVVFKEISRILGVDKSVLKEWDNEFGFEAERFKAKEISSRDGVHKEKTRVSRTVNNQLYNGKYYVIRTVVSKHLYLFNIEDIVRFDFNVCEVREEQPNYKLTGLLEWVENENRYRHYDGIEADDLTDELKKYFIEKNNQKIYFFNKAFYKGKELPLYYGLLYLGDATSIYEDNKDNHYQDFITTRDSELVKHIYSQELKPSYVYEHFTFLHFYGDAINMYLQWHDEQPIDAISEYIPKINCLFDFQYNYSGDKISFREYIQSLIAFTEYWEKRLNKSDEPALRAYMQAVIDSFVDRLKLDGHCSRCEHCGRIIKLKSGKKYCSFREEGRDCGRSARNKRSYDRRKESIPTEK